MTKELCKRAFLSIAADSAFSLQNLPLGIFSTRDDPQKRVGSRLGDFVLDLAFLETKGLLATSKPVCNQSDLSAFMALGRKAWVDFRDKLLLLFEASNP